MMDNPDEQIEEMIRILGSVAEAGRKINSGLSRSREMSLMITNVEQGILWLTARQNKSILDDEQEGLV